MREEKPRPVAGDDLEDEVRSLVVGKDADLGRQREVLEVAADASRLRRLQRCARHQGLPELVLDVAHCIAVAGVGVRRVVHVEGVERVAVTGGVDPAPRESTAARGRRSRRGARRAPSGREDRSSPEARRLRAPAAS